MSIVSAFIRGFVTVFVAKTAYYAVRDVARAVKNK